MLTNDVLKRLIDESLEMMINSNDDNAINSFFVNINLYFSALRKNVLDRNYYKGD